MIMVEKDKEATYDTDDKGNGLEFIHQRCQNIKSDYIEITSDKLENILLKHLHKVGSEKAWITPTSLFGTLLVTKLTSEFKNTFLFSASIWDAILIVSAVATFLWLCFSLRNLKCFRQESSLDSLMSKIKSKDNG